MRPFEEIEKAAKKCVHLVEAGEFYCFSSTANPPYVCGNKDFVEAMQRLLGGVVVTRSSERTARYYLELLDSHPSDWANVHF